MRRPPLPLLLVVLFACAPATPPPAAVPAQPQLAASAIARRVVLMSFDGMGADALARQQNLPAFERLAREGASARVINVNPTLTAPTHVSILTGADPQRTGMVSNRFHLPGTPIEKVARGMDIETDVETIVEVARRQGKRVGAVPFPTLDNRGARRTADFGIAWGMPRIPARIVTLTRNDFKREWVPPTWTNQPQRRASFSPVMRARIPWAFRLDAFLAAYDTTNDGRENYDAYFVEADDREIAADERGWFALSRRMPEGLHGSWSKFLRTSPSLAVTIYWGAISRNDAWPDSFRELLDENAGFWPGEPDDDLHLDAATFTEQLQRLADFYTRVQTVTIAREPFDLLLAYQPQVDEAAHEYLGTSDGDAVLRAAFEAADRAVGAIADALNEDDALLVTGDHGLIATTREVRINRLLADRGFAPRWRAFTSGAFAHLYRFEGDDDSDAVVAMLESSGYFERVEKKSATSHRNSGDVMAWGFPDVAVLMDDSPRDAGQHGALNTHRELHPPLFAIGRGVPVGNLGEIAQTKIAPFVMELLGLSSRA